MYSYLSISLNYGKKNKLHIIQEAMNKEFKLNIISFALL